MVAYGIILCMIICLFVCLFVWGFVCLFVCLFVWGFVCLGGFFVRGFSTHSRIFHSYEDVTIAGERLHNLTYARHLWVIEPSGLLGVPHLLRHGASVYNGHLRGQVTLTSNPKRLAVEMSLTYFYDLSLSDSNTQPSACEANALASAAVCV